VTQISDELLMAYADGELDGNDRASVESYVAQSAEAASRFAVFAGTGRALAEIFERPMLEPVPQRLIDAIYAPVRSSKPAGVAADENVIPFVVRRQPARAPSRPAFQHNLMLAAACVSALALTAGAYWVSIQPGSGAGETFATAQSSNGQQVASTELASVLDTVLGDTVAVRDIAGAAASIKPVFTFATADKTFCRQYEIARVQAQSIGGVACRDSAGQWRIETHVAFDPAPAKAGDIKTAGKSVVEPVEKTVSRLISGDVLGNDQEAALMQGGWKSVSP
jgi:anti-sigma factor RsiW